MSKVLIIVGSPRENGNTASLAAAFAEGAKSAGHEVDTYSLAKGSLSLIMLFTTNLYLTTSRWH